VWRWEGAASLAILLAVLPWQLARWRGADGAMNAALLAPWLLFSAYWDNASRFFTLLLPLVAVAKARWLAAAGGWVAGSIRLPAAACRPVLPLVAAALLLRPALALVPRPTPYLEAADLLARSWDPRHLSTNPRLGNAYFGNGAAVQFPLADSEVDKLRRAGWRWAVTDIQAFFGGFDRPEERLATAVRTARFAKRVLEVPYGRIALAQFILEQDLGFDDARALLAQVEAAGPTLHVYDLSAADGRRRR
jgi:hypothetical protein